MTEVGIISFMDEALEYLKSRSNKITGFTIHKKDDVIDGIAWGFVSVGERNLLYTGADELKKCVDELGHSKYKKHWGTLEEI